MRSKQKLCLHLTRNAAQCKLFTPNFYNRFFVFTVADAVKRLFIYQTVILDDERVLVGV